MEARQDDGHGRFNYIVVQELSPQFKNTVHTEAIVEMHRIGISNHVKEQTEKALPIPNDLKVFISDEKKRIEDYLNKTANIKPESIKFNDLYYIQSDERDTKLHPATSLVGMVRLRNLPIMMDHVKNYQEAVLAAHELYHDVAPVKLTETGVERNGMVYRSGGGNKALEEGLAIKHQILSEKYARKMFPKGAEDYDMVEKYIEESQGYKPEEENLVIVGWNSYGNVDFIRQSKTSTKLIDYLQNEIPDFLGQIERARIEHKTLEIARSIEKRFGRGSYKLIVNTPQDKAAELLEALKTRITTEVKIL